jgi:hypothetical protein
VLILPLIDLMILAGTLFLGAGFVMKAIDLATRYHPSVLGFSSLDFVLFAGICWVFALTLSARTWVKLNEPRLLVLRREQMQAEARRTADDMEARAHEARGGASVAAAGEQAHVAGAERG